LEIVEDDTNLRGFARAEPTGYAGTCYAAMIKMCKSWPVMRLHEDLLNSHSLPLLRYHCEATKRTSNANHAQEDLATANAIDRTLFEAKSSV
jgi:hypothetical protein